MEVTEVDVEEEEAGTRVKAADPKLPTLQEVDTGLGALITSGEK